MTNISQMLTVLGAGNMLHFSCIISLPIITLRGVGPIITPI